MIIRHYALKEVEPGWLGALSWIFVKREAARLRLETNSDRNKPMGSGHRPEENICSKTDHEKRKHSPPYMLHLTTEVNSVDSMFKISLRHHKLCVSVTGHYSILYLNVDTT